MKTCVILQSSNVSCMVKFTLNERGFSAFCTYLYSGNDGELEQQVVMLTVDPVAYFAANFEMNVFQLEYLRSLNRSGLLLLGYSMGAALLGRRPITISFRRDKTELRCADSCILVTCKISSHCSGEQNSTTGDLNIIIYFQSLN